MDSHGRYWDDEREEYSSSYSDDSPILSNRCEKRRYAPYVATERHEERERRTLTVVAKFFIFSTAMILFCVLLYIPVYNKANYPMPKGIVAGWSMDTNRDTKIYVQPNNETIIHVPRSICHENEEKNKLLLLIIVCSSTVNFERRMAIRESWGNYNTYPQAMKILKIIKERYKNYNYTHNLYDITEDYKLTNVSENLTEVVNERRDISIKKLLPDIAKALKTNLRNKKTEVPERRFDDDDEISFNENSLITDLDATETNYEDYESNIMRIPPKGEEKTPDLNSILNQLKETRLLETFDENESRLSETVPDFKLVFLVGLPAVNNTKVQNKIEDEVRLYGDIIQEGFVDSYNNLTLKSIMMLKWVNNKCKESVRYILKTDDDVYVNVPNLVLSLQNRAREFDATSADGEKEYLLIGDLIWGARPVLDTHNKWYSPRYMYGGRVYPRYVSGTGYVLSAPAALALYRAALATHLFHLEDIYITGMCSVRATPRITPRDDPLFSYRAVPRGGTCHAHAQATAHKVSASDMITLHRKLLDLDEVDRCERIRLTKVRRDRMRPKQTKKPNKS